MCLPGRVCGAFHSELQELIIHALASSITEEDGLSEQITSLNVLEAGEKSQELLD